MENERNIAIDISICSFNHSTEWVDHLWTWTWFERFWRMTKRLGLLRRRENWFQRFVRSSFFLNYCIRFAGRAVVIFTEAPIYGCCISCVQKLNRAEISWNKMLHSFIYCSRHQMSSLPVARVLPSQNRSIVLKVTKWRAHWTSGTANDGQL